MLHLKNSKIAPTSDTKSDDSFYAHYLTLSHMTPFPRGEFVNEVKEVVEEIKKWKHTFDHSIRFRWSHKMGHANQLSKQALGNDLKYFILNEVEEEHIKMLNRDPTIYTSRLALAESILEKNENLDPKDLRVLLLHVTVANYTQKNKVKMGKVKEMLSNRNLSLVVNTQIRYLTSCIQEATAELMNYQRKIYANKNHDAYYQQAETILEQIASLKSNIGNMKYLKSLSQRLLLEQSNLFQSNILLNLSVFDTLEHQSQKISEKDIHRIQQSIYSLVQIIRHSPLLYPLAYSILERMQSWEVVNHIQLPMSSFARSQLLGYEYLMVLEEFKNSPKRLKADIISSIFAIFGEWLSFMNSSLAKLSVPNSDPKLQNSATIDFCNYILRHFYAFEMFHSYLPTGYNRSRMVPLLNKGLRTLRYIGPSEPSQKLERALGEALNQI